MCGAVSPHWRACRNRRNRHRRSKTTREDVLSVFFRPVQTTWIKVGVDPRFNAANGLDQTVTGRDRSWFRRRARGGRRVKRKEGFARLAIRSRGITTRRTRFERFQTFVTPALPFLRDVEGKPEFSRRLRQGAGVVLAADRRRGRALGWLRSGAFRKIQRAILRGYQTLMNGGDPIATDEAAMDAVDDDRSGAPTVLAPADSRRPTPKPTPKSTEFSVPTLRAASDSDDAYDE